MNATKRFFEKVEYSHDCWQWTGASHGSGYGAFYFNGGYIGAHRWSYQYFIGPIVKHEVCHHCDNRLCVNPFHLFNGDQKDNAIDREQKGRGRWRREK